MKKTAFFSIILVVFFASNLSAQQYNLPFYANNLKPGERWSTKDHAQTTSQKYGYDLGVKRRISGSKSWSSIKISSDKHWDNPKNSNYLIYGKPVYAMRSGKVIKCWRNAPNNPRPKLPGETGEELEDKMWLHKEYRNRRIPGGGNEVLIQHSDGTKALYAHFKPGSVPSSICPNNKTLYSKPGESEAEVPEDKQVFVKKGKLIGRAGNSGNSTNPHLHIHLEKDGKGKKIYFKRGLAASNSDNKADINKWTSFSGKIIPKGKVLIWPPTRLTKEYARHKYPASSFQRLFTHLSNSGFMLEWIDGYRVGSKTYFNFIWRPANAKWRAYFGRNSKNYQSAMNKAKADGYIATHVESYLTSKGIRYAAIFKKASGSWRARHGIGYTTHKSVLDKAKKDGYKPKVVSVVSYKGKRYYTTLFNKKSIGKWQSKSRLSEKAYQKATDDNKKAGRYPIYISAYMHSGKPNFSAIFAEKPKGKWRARHNLSVSGYQSEWQKFIKAGYLTRVVTGYDGAKKNHVFAAMWRK